MEWITVAEAAQRMGVTVGRVRHYLQEGRIKAKKFGVVWMVSASAAAKFKPNRPGRPNSEDAKK